MRIGTTYPAFNYDIERSFRNALGSSTELVLIKTYEDLENVNLLAFPGGEDVAPSFYNQNNIHSYGVNTNRDTREQFLYKHAVSLGIPMFGMCRGLQILAVMLGQSLVQDIYSELEQIHRGTHPIDVIIPSIVSRNFSVVNSLHHQGVYYDPETIQSLKNLKYSNIYVTSYHNNIVESFESKNIIATQFHPEFMFSKESESFFTDLGEWVEKKGFTFDEAEYNALLQPKRSGSGSIATDWLDDQYRNHSTATVTRSFRDTDSAEPVRLTEYYTATASTEYEWINDVTSSLIRDEEEEEDNE